MASPMPPIPWPGDREQTITVTIGAETRTIVLTVPPHGYRCDQHAVSVDGVPMYGPQTATSIGHLVAGMVCKRASVALLSEPYG